MDKKENIISLLVNNKPDVLARVAGTLGGKGYNIETLCVDVTINPNVSKIILTTIGTKATVQKIEAQLAAHRRRQGGKPHRRGDGQAGAGAHPDEPHGGQQG